MTPTEKKLHALDLHWEQVCKDKVADERRQLLREVAKLEGLLSCHPDPAAAREHNVKTVRALVARLRGKP